MHTAILYHQPGEHEIKIVSSNDMSTGEIAVSILIKKKRIDWCVDSNAKHITATSTFVWHYRDE